MQVSATKQPSVLFLVAESGVYSQLPITLGPDKKTNPTSKFFKFWATCILACLAVYLYKEVPAIGAQTGKIGGAGVAKHSWVQKGVPTENVWEPLS